VAGPLPAEEPGRVTPGTHVEEEERDDKVKPGHPQVCHFHFNLRTHLVLGRGGVLRPVNPQPWGLSVPSEVTASQPPHRPPPPWSPSRQGRFVRGAGARCRGSPEGGRPPAPSRLGAATGGSRGRGARGATGVGRRRCHGKPTPGRGAEAGGGEEGRREARASAPPGPSGPQTSLLAPGLGVGDWHAEEAVPLEPSGEAGPGLVPVPGVGRAPGREGVELSGRRSQSLPVGREGCDGPVPTEGEDGAAHSPRLPGRASSRTLFSAAVRQGHPGLASLCPTQGRWVSARQPRHLLLRNPGDRAPSPEPTAPLQSPRGLGASPQT
ncbi:hypothetical protein EI555_019780, partial [Monodon monoceros]